MALIECPECKKEISDMSTICIHCGFPVKEYLDYCYEMENQESEYEFNGIYKYTFFGEKQEVYCPRCGSDDCSYYHEQKIIPGKKKTRYEWSQKQREIEREVRKQKTTANMAKAAGDKQLVKDCNTRIKALKAKYNDLTESVGLQKTEERMRVVK